MNQLAVVTLEDRRAVYALLDRYLDWLPPTRLAVRRAEDGVKPGVGRWRRCETCDGQGRVLGEGRAQRACRQPHVVWPPRHGCRPCPAACEAGFVRLHGKQAAEGTDRMIERVVGKETGVDVTASYAKAERRRSVDAQLVKIAALQRQHDGVEDAPDDWTRAHDAKERLWRSGSFPSLELALELLALTAPLRLEALRLFVIDQHFDPDLEVRERLDEIVDWIAARIRRPILLPADAKAELAAWKRSLEHGRDPRHQEQRRARDLQIVELVETQHWSLRRVGTVFDLSHERVRAIVAQANAVAAASGPAA